MRRLTQPVRGLESLKKHKSSGGFPPPDQRVQDAVVEDQGVYYDPEEYLYSDKYANKMNFLKYFMLEQIMFPRINNWVRKLRSSCSAGLCA